MKPSVVLMNLGWLLGQGGPSPQPSRFSADWSRLDATEKWVVPAISAIRKLAQRKKSVAVRLNSRQTSRDAVVLALSCIGKIKMNGISLARKLLVRFKSLVPSDLRTYYQPFIYGLVGGLSAVAFRS